MIFSRHKTLSSASATNPEIAEKNMTGFISRVINYVESRVPPKSKIDEWDIHKALINDVLRCTMQPAGKQNFKRAMDTILRWCSKGTGKNGEGRMTTEPTFPKDGEFEKNVRLIKTLWSDFKSSILEPSLTQRSSEAEINIAIDAYMPYFDDAAKRSEVSKSIAEVYRNSKKPAKFVKTNNRCLCPECHRTIRRDKISRHLDEMHKGELRNLKVDAKQMDIFIRKAGHVLVTRPYLAKIFSSFEAHEEGIVAGLRQLGYVDVEGLSLREVLAHCPDDEVLPSSPADSHVSEATPVPETHLSETPLAAPCSPRLRTSANPPAIQCDRARVPQQPRKGSHPFLQHFLLTGPSLFILRRILAHMGELANGADPDVWMIGDSALLERLIISRQNMSHHTIRKDLLTLRLAARVCSHPQYSAADRSHACALLDECVELLGRPVNMSVGRRQKDAVKDHLARDEPSFELWRHELDTVFNETDGLVEVQKRNISKQWIRVNRHLFHSVSAVLGYAATSRLTLDCWQSNKTLSKQLKNRLHWLRRLRQRVMLSCDFLFMNTQGKPLDPKYQ